MRFFVYQFGHKRTAHERPREDRAKAKPQAVRFVLFKHVRVDVLFDRQVMSGGLQVLAYGRDINVVRAQVFEQSLHFVARLSKPDHETGFRKHLRRVQPRAPQHVERLPVVRLRAHPSIKARHCFDVVIESVGSRIKYSVKRVPISFEVGRKDFDFCLRQAAADCVNGSREMLGPAVGQFVAIDRSDDDVTERELSRSFGHLFRLSSERVHRQPPACFDRAEAATARADVAQYHESGRAARKAIISIRASRFFANGMQPASAKHLFQFMIGFDVALRLAKPFGQSRPAFRSQSFDLNKHI